MRAWICGLLMLLCGVPGVADCAERRVALIVGNDSYVKISPLHNAANDAHRMEQALKAAGFETTVKIDAKRRGLYSAIDAFAAQIAASTETVGLFYYAGHGIQANGNNYLIPVDADIDSDSDLEAEAVDAGKVLRAMGEAHNRLNIVILDACRDNPLPRSTRSVSRGLARMDAPTGTFIAYAAGPGQTAQDGSAGGNGLFTGELVKAMAQPGLPIESVFKKAAAGVMSQTGNKQVPWTEASLQGDFYFQNAAVTKAAAAPAATAPVPASAANDAAAYELAYWNSVKDAKNPAEIKAYLDKYPKGAFADIAQVKYDELRTAAKSAAAHENRTANANPPVAAPPTSQPAAAHENRVAMANPPAAAAPPVTVPTPAPSSGGRGYLQMGLEWSQAESAAVAKNVTEGGAAARAGIQNGDVLVALDNQKIQSMDDVNRFVLNTKPGQSVDVMIRRHGIPSIVRNLILGSGPAGGAPGGSGPAGGAPGGSGPTGAALALAEDATGGSGSAAATKAQDMQRLLSSRAPAPPNGFASEREDFGVSPQSTLQFNVGTHTPTSIPGAHVVTTEMLARISRAAVLIDAWNDRSHATLPGAIRMTAAGIPGNFNDQVQSGLGAALAMRTNHNFQQPLVFFCAGINCWESYNAALRAVQMGYREVFWYRGGVAAWQAAGLTLVPP